MISVLFTAGTRYVESVMHDHREESFSSEGAKQYAK